ncbi:MAG: hypothetical protein NT075_27155 [Chloroflexi bacterium]|nr:hypothetical protein [Chloroflexota bacterium]
MVATVISKHDITIRLTDERWAHIIEEHAELAELQATVLAAVETPTHIFAGNAGELMATQEIELGKWLVVVYREIDRDGFIITAFLTRRRRQLERRKQIWP